MRRDRSLTVGPVLLILLTMPIGEIARGDDSAVWMHDPQTAFAKAQRLNRPVLLHFHAGWCVPCQTMERGVLNQRDVLDALAGDFVAVKVDYDQHTELAEQLEIATLPADVFLYPDGRPFARVSKPADLPLYLNRLVAARDRFEQRDGQRQIATEPKTDAETRIEAPEPLGRSSAKLARGERQRIGLDGFCPVALWSRRAWERGKPTFAAEHEGVTFRMSSAANAREFQANPQRYAPRLLGCDPVVLAESGRAVAGSSQFCLFYDGELYLFLSTATKEQFAREPLKYARLKQVLRSEEVESVRR